MGLLGRVQFIHGLLPDIRKILKICLGFFKFPLRFLPSGVGMF